MTKKPTDPKVRKRKPGRKVDLSGDSVEARELLKFGGGVAHDGSSALLIFNDEEVFEMTSAVFGHVVESMNDMHREMLERQKTGGVPPKEQMH